MPKIKDSAHFSALNPKRVRLDSSDKAVAARQRKAIEILGHEGAMRSSALSTAVGYEFAGSGAPFLRKMLEAGKIEKTGRYYHLRGQSPVPMNLGKDVAKRADFFNPSSLAGKLRQYLKDHQDEPTTIQALADAVGYTSSGAASSVLQRMLNLHIIRRYRAPEDMSFMWRYQYVDPELSGIKTSHLPEGTLVKKHQFAGVRYTHYAADNCPMVEVKPEIDDTEEVPVAEAIDFATLPQPEPETPAQPQPEATGTLPQSPTSLQTAANIMEYYGKEFLWQTGSRDTREFSLWLRERALGEK